MYFSDRTYEIPVSYFCDIKGKKSSIREKLNITLYFKNYKLNEDGFLIDYDSINKFMVDIVGNTILNELIDVDNITLEIISQWIYEQVIPCYKVKVVTSEGYNITYIEED